jgi:hypothetical protein
MTVYPRACYGETVSARTGAMARNTKIKPVNLSFILSVPRSLFLE